MFSGGRVFGLGVAAFLLVGAMAVQPSLASETGPREFSASAPSPAAPVRLDLDLIQNPALKDGDDVSAKVEEDTILPVPLPPALLCLMTAFAGLAVLSRRRAGGA